MKETSDAYVRSREYHRNAKLILQDLDDPFLTIKVES